MEYFFWICGLGLFYIYAGYPLLIRGLAYFLPHPVCRERFAGEFSVLIVAHNEAEHLSRKLKSILAADNADQIAEIIVASDGSSDNTTDVVRGFINEGSESAGSRIRLVEFEERRGKPVVLNDVVPQCRSDIIVLTDARQELAPSALNRLLAAFADPRVGVVSGELVFRLASNGAESSSDFSMISGERPTPNSQRPTFRAGPFERWMLIVERWALKYSKTSEAWGMEQGAEGSRPANGNKASAAVVGMGFYWNYEKFIRGSESIYASVPGATGALYAVRRELFRAFSGDALLDDVIIPMQAVMQGKRCILESGALVYDVPSHTPEAENVRKRRTIAGNAQLLRLYPGWMLPWRNPIWWQFFSHKIMRLSSPFLLIGLLISNLVLVAHSLYAGMLILQMILYLAALAGWTFHRRGRNAGLLGIPLMFVSLNLITLVAFHDAISGRWNVTWKK